MIKTIKLIKRRIYKCGKLIYEQQAIKNANLNIELKMWRVNKDGQRTPVVRKALLNTHLSSWEKVEKCEEWTDGRQVISKAHMNAKLSSWERKKLRLC